MLEAFKHPRVRDVAWVMCSPSMLKDDAPQHSVFTEEDCELLFNKALDKLYELENNPTHLLSYLERFPSQRVGGYFEILVHGCVYFAPVSRNLYGRGTRETYKTRDVKCGNAAFYVECRARPNGARNLQNTRRKMRR